MRWVPAKCDVFVLESSVKTTRQTWGRSLKLERPERTNSTIWLKKQVTHHSQKSLKHIRVSMLARCLDHTANWFLQNCKLRSNLYNFCLFQVIALVLLSNSFNSTVSSSFYRKPELWSTCALRLVDGKHAVKPWISFLSTVNMHAVYYSVALIPSFWLSSPFSFIHFCETSIWSARGNISLQL